MNFAIATSFNTSRPSTLKSYAMRDDTDLGDAEPHVDGCDVIKARRSPSAQLSSHIELTRPRVHDVGSVLCKSICVLKLYGGGGVLENQIRRQTLENSKQLAIILAVLRCDLHYFFLCLSL